MLEKCFSIDEDAFRRIHKGSANDWIGIAAFMIEKYELATFFFYAVVAEDIRAGHDPINNPTPSFRI